MESIMYDIVWPGGNTTAIVRSSVPVTDYVTVAKRILSRNPEVEQVGFLLAPYSASAQGRLVMMGGEFCGNATRCAAFLLARELGLNDVRVEIPGISEPVLGQITESEASIRLPMDFCRKISPCPEGAVVDLQGIRHVVITAETAEAKESLLAKYKENYAAVGLIYVRDTNGILSIDPHVWVRDTDTFYHETACGSGSLAVGFSLREKNGGDAFLILQPSGSSLSVTFTNKMSVSLAGPIRSIGEATLR